MYPEINTSTLWSEILNMEYDGYLAYGYNEMTGKFNDKPGQYSTSQSKELGFDMIKTYLSRFASSENHDEWLEEVMKINSFQDMKFNDLFSASVASFMGEEGVKIRVYSSPVQSIAVEACYPAFRRK
jgi:hypothetical protein